MITVLLVDDQPRLRRGLRMRLEMEADIKVVGEATGGEAALSLVARLHPRVVVMDVELPGMDGLSAAAALRLVCSDCAVVILTQHSDSSLRRRAQAAGAAAFVEKPATGSELAAVIRKVAHPV